MRQILLHGLRTIAFLVVLTPRAHAPTRQNELHVMSVNTIKADVSYGMDFRATDVLRPRPGRGEVLVRIAASGVNTLDTKISDGAAAHARHVPSAILRSEERRVGKEC